MVLFCGQQWLKNLVMVVRPVRCNDPQNKRVDVDVLCLVSIAYIMLFCFMPV